MTSPRKAPARKVFHRNWRKGYWVNSILGTLAAVAAFFGWIDNDLHLSSDGKWVNAHGNPEKFWLRRGKFEDHTWAWLSKLTRKRGGHTYRLRTGGQTLRDNAARGLRTELEVKDVHPIGSAKRRAAFKRLAAAARAAYGDDWRNHVTVKVLTNLAGGTDYALMVCRAAHAAGFKTMILARGKARFRRFAGVGYVTWVRSSAVVIRR